MIGVTGASGKLGRQVVEELSRNVPTGEIVALARDPAKIADLAARGVKVRPADHGRPETLGPALAGVDKLLLVSGPEVGRRVPQHLAVIDAARKAGVKLLAYTSVLHADMTRLALAEDHLATERAIRASDLPFAFLRNSWYLENYTEHLAPILAHGAVLGCARQGRVGAASRADFAAAAAAVLARPGQEGTVHELAGDEPFTLAELAAEIARQTGKPIVYRDLPREEFEAALTGAGVPAAFAKLLADSDVGIARGELADGSGTLRRLIGRPTTTLPQAVATALAAR